jgi:hypothetical protein
MTWFNLERDNIHHLNSVPTKFVDKRRKSHIGSSHNLFSALLKISNISDDFKKKNKKNEVINKITNSFSFKLDQRFKAEYDQLVKRDYNK